MLTPSEQYLIDLVKKSIIPDAPYPVMPSDAVVDRMARIIMTNGVLLTVFPTLESDKTTKAQELKNMVKKQYYAYVKQTVMQNHEGNRVLTSLSEAGFDVIALKGWELRKLYPDITRRSMADLDILVKNYDFKRITEIMNRLGFSNKQESSWKHDDFSKGKITVEMHKRLTDDSNYIQEWEKRMWDHSTPSSDNGHIYKMSYEDYYIFHMLHLSRDFKHGSLGLRRIADTWLFLNNHKDLNREYLNQEFKSMDILTFVNRIEKLAEDCFENSSIDENSLLILKHALNPDIYANTKSYKIGRIASMSDGSLKKGKFKSFWAAIFLPYSRMKSHFPILKKWPILLPFYWIKRILFYAKNYRMYKSKLDYSNISQDDYDQMKAYFTAGGIS